MIHLTGPILAGDGERTEAWVDGGTITYRRPGDGGARNGQAGEEAETRRSEGEPARRVDVIDGYVVPGLVDVHCHVGLGPEGGVDPETAERQAITDRDTGVLLIRDAGVPVGTRWVDSRPDLPVLIRAGRHIARPRRYLRGLPVDLDDVRQLPDEMARQARAGDGWVKIVADWIDRSLGPDAVVAPLWPADVLREGIAAAHENGARVTAHAFSHASIGPLLDAGIDCIEHGTGMDHDHMMEAARRGIPVTPTLLQADHFGEFADAGRERFPAYSAQMQAMFDRREQQVRDFAESGIQLLPGSDSGGTLPHGILAAELQRWQDAGIPAAEILALATWRARAFLGATALEEGAQADLVAYASDPRRDIEALEHPAAVVLRGEQVA